MGELKGGGSVAVAVGVGVTFHSNQNLINYFYRKCLNHNKYILLIFTKQRDCSKIDFSFIIKLQQGAENIY